MINSGYILKIELTRFSYELDIRSRREKSRDFSPDQPEGWGYH